MSLDEPAVEHLPERCEECGAKLTPEEQQAVLETGGPALCKIHIAEDEPGLEVDESGFQAE